MKESKYNIYIDVENKEQLIFNGMSCALAVVDDLYKELVDMLPQIPISGIPEHLTDCYESALESRFIVNDECDELLEYTAVKNIQKYNTDSLVLTIAPTLMCNFKCIYCYETETTAVMSQSVMDSISYFIEQQVAKLRKLHITWYGGEPLLCSDLLFSLSERIIELCEQNSIEYSASIVSNGSLINDNIVDLFVKHYIKNIQITIDGVENIHNTRRIAKNGKGTYLAIIDNINKLLKKDYTNVGIRINVDNTNLSEIPLLLKDLNRRLFSKKVKISFGQVAAYTSVCKSVETNCIDNAKFAKFLAQSYKWIEENDFSQTNKFPYPETKFNYCTAELLNSFVIDPEGYLYKCWNEIGQIELSVGNVNDKTFCISNTANIKKVSRYPEKSEPCLECKLLPVCAGGCSQKELDIIHCDYSKYNFSDSINFYLNKCKL